MEDKEGPSPGVTVKGDEAPEGYHVAPRTENPTPYAGPTMQATAAPPARVAAPPGPSTGSEMKKKRGRPRKYRPDGSLAMTLSPMPISSSIPLGGEFSPWKRGRGRPVDAVKKSHKYEFESSPEYCTCLWTGKMVRYQNISQGASATLFCALVGKVLRCSSCYTPNSFASQSLDETGKRLFSSFPSPYPSINLDVNDTEFFLIPSLDLGDGIAYFVGANFTPHVITVNAGEDVTMKVMSFSQQGARAICILSANGTISNVTLRQPTSSGGTLTYEGRFEILSLSGSFMPTENAGTKSRSGGMSVSLAGPDGRVLGGGLAGLLVAAGPVQVVVGSFLPGHQQEQKHKKQRTEPAAAVVSPTAVHTMSTEEIKVSYGGVRPILTSPFPGDNLGTLNPIQAFRNSAIDNKSSSAGEESKGHSLSQCEVSS
ncbi:AT hook motif DNA-binding family protein [Theobroma cacao]|uniref:AT-hook motif nuclear-localized protein n=1 Tax=Theobroma cacao TaxID=3641 RepID=A0A061G177_THECC|nr:AT hook motif DNA-binding family protein [Theobroma cacao]